jgi:tetratricopeptide (TPR) repeat protein
MGAQEGSTGDAVRGLAVAMLVLGAAAAEAERNPPHSALEDQALADFYNLDYDQALELFRAESVSRPSAEAFNHVAQTIVFRAMFRARVLDSGMIANTGSVLQMKKVPMAAADDAEFNSAMRRAMELSEARLKRDANDTGALYSLGVSHGLVGNYDAVVNKKYFDALRESTAARKLHNRVVELDPAFVDARLTQGLNDYIVGSLPVAWKMLGFLGGFRGDRQRGIQTLEQVAQHGVSNQTDAQLMLTAIYRREKEAAKSIALLNDLIARLPRNYLLRFELAEMYGDLRETSRALEVVDEVERMKTAHVPGYDRVPEDQIRALRKKVGSEERARQ